MDGNPLEHIRTFGGQIAALEAKAANLKTPELISEAQEALDKLKKLNAYAEKLGWSDLVRSEWEKQTMAIEVILAREI